MPRFVNCQKDENPAGDRSGRSLRNLLLNSREGTRQLRQMSTVQFPFRSECAAAEVRPSTSNAPKLRCRF